MLLYRSIPTRALSYEILDENFAQNSLTAVVIRQVLALNKPMTMRVIGEVAKSAVIEPGRQ